MRSNGVPSIASLILLQKFCHEILPSIVPPLISALVLKQQRHIIKYGVNELIQNTSNIIIAKKLFTMFNCMADYQYGVRRVFLFLKLFFFPFGLLGVARCSAFLEGTDRVELLL